MKIAFLFAGQGVQHVGMGRDLFNQQPKAQEVFNYLNDETRDVCFNGPIELLNDTLYAQPCIVACSLAIAEVLRMKGVVAEYAAGLSLGEYSALAYSGVIHYADVLKIVKKRGQIMANALANTNSGMLAVLGSDLAQIKDVVARVEGLCEIANYNCPGQIVLTGSKEALLEASIKFSVLKVKTIQLNVSGAFHSSLLNNASEELAEVLGVYNFTKGNIPVVFNTTANSDDSDVKGLLKAQIKSSVMFWQSVEYLIEQGVDTFIEIGPGKVLSGFVKRINKDVNIFNVEDLDSINNLVEVLNNGK